MKNAFIPSVVAAALLAVTMVSCTPLQQTAGDDYYDPEPRVSSAPNRIWIDDPYRPGATILMERDPYSGRYYPVPAAPYGAYGAYGGVYPAPSPYGAPVPYGAYDPYNRGGYNRPRSYPRRNESRGTAQPAPTPQQLEQERRAGEQRRKEATNQILGRKQ